jgi:hypothetical protein
MASSRATPGVAVTVFDCATDTEWVDNLVYPVREDKKCEQGWLYTYVCSVCRGLVVTNKNSRCGRDFLHPSRPALGFTQSPAQWTPGLFPGKKRPKRSVDHSPHLAPKLKTE